MSEREAVSVLISIDLESGVEYDSSQIWPDGDAPKNPTAQDVADLLHLEGRQALTDWDLLADVRLSICVTTTSGRRTYADVTL